jgi:ketol-acid reductoisomerase
LIRIYYDKDAEVGVLSKKVVGIIGYGIQGRAQALNLRDSGIEVQVGNRNDEYVSTILADGFNAKSIEEVCKSSDIIILLIPDQAHREVYADHVGPYLRQGGSLVVAHGYSIHFDLIKPRNDIDVMLLAPRMPGKQIRDYYIKGSGVPVFVDVVQDITGSAWPKVLSLAKGMGFTRAGALHVSIQEETEIDLFVEQFLVPTIIKAIHVSFDELVAAGYAPLPTAMELHASGELGEVLLMAARSGLYGTFQKNSSPTCQFGITLGLPQVSEGDLRQRIAKVIQRIRSGEFAEALEKEGQTGYAGTQALWDQVEQSLLVQTERTLRQKFRGRFE